MMNGLSNRRRGDQICDMWKEDAPFATDIEGLIQAQSHHYTLHQKYSQIKINEQRRLAKMKGEVESFHFKLMRFYRDGAIDVDTLKVAREKGWEIPPEGKPYLKTDVKLWVDTNHTMAEMVVELSEQNDV